MSVSLKVSMKVPGGDELILTANNVLSDDIPERLETMGKAMRHKLNPEYYVRRLEELQKEITQVLNDKPS